MKKFTKSQVEIIKLSDRIVEFLKSQGETKENAEGAVLAVLKESITTSRQNYKEAARNLRMIFCEAFGETTEQALHREAMGLMNL